MESHAVFFHFKSGNVICRLYKTGVCLYVLFSPPPSHTYTHLLGKKIKNKTKKPSSYYTYVLNHCCLMLLPHEEKQNLRDCSFHYRAGQGRDLQPLFRRAVCIPLCAHPETYTAGYVLAVPQPSSFLHCMTTPHLLSMKSVPGASVDLAASSTPAV